MKNLPIFSAIASLVAVAIFPGPAVAGSLLFSLGLISIFAADYKRVARPLALQAPSMPVEAFSRSASRSLACDLAA